MNIDHYIASKTTYSRRDILRLIKENKVKVNDVVVETLTFDINDKHYQYKKFEQKKVIFGIRPENILIVDSVNNNQNTYVSEIDFIENLRSEMNIQLSYKSKKFISRINYD